MLLSLGLKELAFLFRVNFPELELKIANRGAAAADTLQNQCCNHDGDNQEPSCQLRLCLKAEEFARYIRRQLRITGHFDQQLVALFSFIFTHKVRYQAASTGHALIEAGFEQGHREPGEGGHHSSDCHLQQHREAVGPGFPGAAAAALLRSADASQQAPHPGVHHVAEQKEDEGRHYEEDRAIQHVPRIAGTLEHHSREDVLSSSCQQGHNAVTQNGLVTDAEI